MELIKTGIAGLDDLLNGGIPRGNQVLISGGPGTGKTMLSLEFLVRNAINGRKGIFFNLEETGEKLKEEFLSAMPNLKEDFDKVIKKGTLILSGRETALRVRGGKGDNPYEIDNLIAQLSETIRNEGVELVVIDSLSVFSLLTDESSVYKRSMYLLTETLQKLNVTSLLTIELTERNVSALKFKSEFFIFDGLIVLYQMIENKKRISEIEIIKMRGNSHSFDVLPYQILPQGIKISVKNMGLY